LSNDRPTKRSSQHLEKLVAGLPPAACHICADPGPPSSSCLHPSTYPHSAASRCRHGRRVEGFLSLPP
jgi:hypothetical protein